MTKKLLFILFAFVALSVSAQNQTVNIDWSFGSNSNATGPNNNADRTIEVGDTVIWDWYSTGTHNVERTGGTSSDNFVSGFMTTGATFSYTFTSVGTNTYQCNPHPTSMFGVITVVPEGTLSVPDFATRLSAINLYPNPASSTLNVEIPSQFKEDLTIEVYNVLGKKILSKTISQLKTSLSISNWNDGVYLIKITSVSLGTTITKRFVKI